MKGFRAALYKDLKLFFGGAGILSLLLPLLLLPALLAGMSDLSGQGFLRPFPIAVRDEDHTLMSRSLISQMEQVDLFSEIQRLEEEPDAAALEQGAAAVVTIPRDFFYDLYTMEDCPVTVTLNGDRKLESALFQGIFQSVMGIIRANQAAGTGLYDFLYGEEAGEHSDTMYRETAEQLLRDALGRQLVFEEGVDPAPDLSRAMLCRMLACVLATLALFFALSAVKTLPEELALGVLPRFRSMGGDPGAFLLSKFLTSLLLTLPGLILASAVSGISILSLFLLDLLLLWAAFGILLAVAAWSGDAAAMQRRGNLILLLSLALGGTLWPRTIFPRPLAELGKLTLPYYAAVGLEGKLTGAAAPVLVSLLWPLPVLGLLGLLTALPGIFHRKKDLSPPVSETGALQPEPGASEKKRARVSAILLRFWRLSLWKLRILSGGIRGLIALLAVCLLCGAAASLLQTGTVPGLKLALCDQDASRLSRALTERLAAEEELEITLLSPDEGRRALLTGEAEGLLWIGEGYEAALEANTQPPLRYESAPSARSAQGAREIVAGSVVAQRAVLRAFLQAEELTGSPLTAPERQQLEARITEIEQAMPPLYSLEREGGSAGDDPFLPGPMSFAALAVLFTLLTAASRCGSADFRLVQRRMLSLSWGRFLSYGSDVLALFLLGLLAQAAVLLWGGSSPERLRFLLPSLLYAACAAALARLLARFTVLEGRVDALAPFLALLLCLLGGCFTDFSLLSPVWEFLSLLTPPGLAVRGAEGSLAASLILAEETAALLLLGFPWREPRRGKA